ncbi:MAG: ankyrin repeat domain-containing protein [Deltaproteobacteria bacterium]|nr:ankyrin repeat domain-containing protein [Deltaproteobacteria bacterium]
MKTLDDAAWTPLHAAALAGELEAVARALDAGVAIGAATSLGVISSAVGDGQLVRPKGNAVYPATLARIDGPHDLAFDEGATALHVAAWAGQRVLVELLLSRGAKVDAKDGIGATALHHAARGGREEIVALLLSKKAKVDVATKKAKSAAFFDAGVTPLHASLEHGHLALTRQLVAAGADPQARTANGNTALFFAARGGDVTALAQLASWGVSLVGAGAYLNDPVLEAITQGHLGVLEALLDEGNVARDTHLREATLRGDDGIRARLLSRGVAPLAHRTPADAARANDVWAIQAMRAEGRDVNEPIVITQAIGMGHARVVSDLLAHGARLDAEKGTHGPLHMAVDRANAEIALALIERGAPLDAKDPHGNTPLFTACMRRGMERPIEAMIARGADPHEVLRHGNSAWKLTETMPAYRALLAKTLHTPDPNARGWESPEVSRVLTDPSLRPTFKEAYRALFDELVPPRDAAPTVQGELVRVSHKLWDEAMRNGNGNFGPRHRAMAAIFDVLRGAPFDPQRERQVREAVAAIRVGSLDDDTHRRVAHAVLDWCVAHPDLIPREP